MWNFFVNINGSTCYLLYTNTEQIDKQDQNKVCGVALTNWYKGRVGYVLLGEKSNFFYNKNY